jgi:histone-lysine N-methyltransferase SUV39H
MRNKSKYTKEEEQCHFCQFRAFEIAKDGYKMAVTNDVDNERIDRGFRFIDKSVYGAGVEKSIAAAHFQAGCGCKADIDCAHDCDCLSDLDKDNIVNPDFKNAYYTAGPRKGLLREEILEVGVDEIYECSHLCSCSENCPNRVVGRGRQFDIEVFRTDDGRGWGMLPNLLLLQLY